MNKGKNRRKLNKEKKIKQGKRRIVRRDPGRERRGEGKGRGRTKYMKE